MIAELMILAGAILTLLSAAGVVRFGDVLARMHALTKSSTLGVLLVFIGAAIALSDPNDVTSLLLAAALQLLTSPVASNLLGRSTYLASGIGTPVDGRDDFAEITELDRGAGDG
jgi:multicomponent Na+:H+ antiporter subunit G